MAYRYLWSPLRLGPVTVRNRIVFSAHLTNYATQDGRPSEQHAAYYEARAAGGAGLIITEEHSTHPTDWPYEKLIHGFHHDVVPGYRRITDAVHRHRVPIFAQLNHNGGQASSMYTRRPVWAPSPVADPLFREVPKAVDETEIAEIVAGYALVAEHCAEGGFDGIELQCSHSSIVRGFLSPATNHRTDGYGGPLEHRARLLLELVAAVRGVIGAGLALGVRLCGDELIEGGTTIDEAVAVAQLVEATGHVDYINTSIGVATASLFMIEASMHVPPGYAMFIPSAIRKAVDLPVVGVGRFKDPLQAERALAEGHCDLVGVVRGQIADADFAAKARAGAQEDIRLCLSCNQECVGRMGLNRWLGCIENPRTGREAEASTADRTASPKEVMVVGAGPAGLQAAIAAARRGHRVTVYEQGPSAGGQVRLAATVPNRAEFGDLVRNQLAECRRLGVTIEYDTGVWPGLVDERRPDHVIVAAGSEPARPWWAPPDAANVIDVRAVLDGSAHPFGDVVVVDELGFHQATSVAELLADRGCRVEIVTNGMVVGQDLGITLDMENWWIRACAKGIVQSTDLVPMGYEGTTLRLLHHPTNEMQERNPDWVVLAVPAQPVEWLYHDLKGRGVSVERVGDCVAPRRAHAAVVEGERAGVGAVIAVVPVRDGALPAGGDEAIAECGGRVLVIGDGAEAAAKELATTAISVKAMPAGAFAPAAWAAALAPHLVDEQVIVLPASPDGRDLAPRLAYALGRTLLAGAVEVRTDGASLARQGGLVLEDVVVAGAFVATLQPGVRGVDGPAHPMTSPDAPVEVLETVDRRIAGDSPVQGTDPLLVAVLPPDVATMDLAEAPRIVAGGAGLVSEDRFAVLARVATALNASLGATRVITDRHWVPHQRQIGTTGVVVDPQLYVALGISGAVQHTSGLGDPDHIVSVNLDPSCPMMQLADLAIVSDANAVLDELAERLGVPDE